MSIDMGSLKKGIFLQNNILFYKINFYVYILLYIPSIFRGCILKKYSQWYKNEIHRILSKSQLLQWILVLFQLYIDMIFCRKWVQFCAKFLTIAKKYKGKDANNLINSFLEKKLLVCTISKCAHQSMYINSNEKGVT